MTLDLTRQAAYAEQTPYELWQQSEAIPIYHGLGIEDLTTVSLGPWKRKGAMGAFINMLGAGRSCDAYVCEIPAKSQSLPEHYLFEELVYVVKGRGATTVWQEGGRKQTFEWQPGSLFSPPLNTWRQHFNGSGTKPARFMAVTSAPPIFNLFRNMDFVFNNPFPFNDRFDADPESFSGAGESFLRKGRHVWDTNFI